MAHGTHHFFMAAPIRGGVFVEQTTEPFDTTELATTSTEPVTTTTEPPPFTTTTEPPATTTEPMTTEPATTTEPMLTTTEPTTEPPASSTTEPPQDLEFGTDKPQQNKSSGSINYVVDKPSDLADGDILLVFWNLGGNNGSPSTVASVPSGFSQVTIGQQTPDNYANIAVYAKPITAVGSEPSNYTFVGNAAVLGTIGAIALKGAAAYGTWTVATPNAGGSSTTHTAPSVTATADGILVCAYAMGIEAGTFSTPSGMTQLFSISNAGVSTALGVMGVFYEEVLAGATGTRVSSTSPISRPWAAVSFVIYP